MQFALDDVVYVTYWTREDIVNEVESLGFDPNTPGLFEAVSKEFSNALEDASESFAILDDIIRDKAAGIAPGELLPEDRQQHFTYTPEKAVAKCFSPKDDLAQARAATSPCMRNHVQNPTRSQGR